MSEFTCAERFARRGDEWNTPNYQHHAVANPWARRRHPDGTLELADRHDIKGYDPVPSYARPRRAEPKPKYVDPKPIGTTPDARKLANALMRSRENIRRMYAK